MRIVGVDPSLSRTGVCVYAGDVPTAHSISASNRLSIYERQLFMVSGVRSFLERGDAVVLEEFGVSVRFAPSGRFVERIEICGMLKFLIPFVTGLPWLSVPPTLLKSFVAGRGSARKEEVLERVRTQWGAAVLNDDEADAFGLAAYARAVLNDDQRYAKKIEKFIAFSGNRAALAKIVFLRGKLKS
jgi:Holliday junction resolvasome RuvABC endonuclease subunit